MKNGDRFCVLRSAFLVVYLWVAVCQEDVAQLGQRFDALFGSNDAQYNIRQLQHAIGDRVEIGSVLSHGDARFAQEAPEAVDVARFFVELAPHGFQPAQEPSLVTFTGESAATDWVPEFGD